MTQEKTKRKKKKCFMHSDTAVTPSSISVLMESDRILMVVLLCFLSFTQTHASLLIFYYLSESLSQCTPSPTRGQASLPEFCFLLQRRDFHHIRASVRKRRGVWVGRGRSVRTGSRVVWGRGWDTDDCRGNQSTALAVQTPWFIRHQIETGTTETEREREKETEDFSYSLFILSLVYLIWLINIY